MSLSPQEHQILDRIADELAGSDPELASLAARFNRAAASGKLRSRSRIAGARRARRGAGYGRGMRRGITTSFLVTVWLLTSAALIVTAVVLNVTSHGTGSDKDCPRASVVGCVDPAVSSVPASSARPRS